MSTKEEEQLRQCRIKIETAKQQMAQAQGSLETYTANLKANHGVSTIEEAEALKSSLDQTLNTLKTELAESLAAIEKIFAEAGV